MRIILEGITGSGKTTLFREINKYLPKNGDNIFSASQFYTSSLIWKNPLKRDANDMAIKIMGKIVDFVTYMDQNFEEYKTDCDDRKLNVLLETFHFENYLRGYLKKIEDFLQFDKELEHLNFKTVLLTISEENILDRAIISTKLVRKSTKWNEYLKSMFNDENQLVEKYIHYQRELTNLMNKTHLNSLILNTDAKEWDTYAKQILEFAKG